MDFLEKCEESYLNYFEKCVELYLNFLQSEYAYSYEDIEETRKEIKANPYAEYGLAYTTHDLDNDDMVELQIDINLNSRKLSYFVDYDLVHDEEFTEEEFIELLENLDFQDLYSDAVGYIEV